MDRRRFVAATACSVVFAPVAGLAQQAGPVMRIGWLWNDPPQTADEIAKAYPTHLRTLGWIEGQNLIIERRYSGGRPELLKAPAEELAGLKLDLIAAEGTIATLAVKSATNSIPIVFARAGDPVRAGLVASLARPGGNVTGTSVISTDLDQKRLQLLHELLPEARRVGELVVPANPIELAARADYERVYRALGIQPLFVEVTTASELENAVDELARRGAQALHVSAEPLLGTNFAKIASAAQRHSLPVMVEERDILQAGGLISYGPDEVELDRQLVLVIDKILRGAKPADLPVQQPRKFELGVNLQVAKVLGIKVPPSLLLRADKVIE
jgi:putative tryptophan/tyrosine transport system substrate-binding protein